MANWPKTMAISELDKIRIECAHDKDIRRKMLADPAGVLKERGIDVPEGLAIRVIEDTPKEYTITLPPFVGTDMGKGLEAKSSANPTWWCTTCTTTTPICAGSLASLTCIA